MAYDKMEDDPGDCRGDNQGESNKERAAMPHVTELVNTNNDFNCLNQMSIIF